jgi:hypothetical protein
MSSIVHAEQRVVYEHGYMHRALARAMRDLPALLATSGNWKSLHVTYEEPHVERLWIPYGDGEEFRLNIHRIRACNVGATLFHPHPWPSASYILRGVYEMQVAYDEREYRADLDLLNVAATFYLPAGTAYEMVYRHGWHAVSPKTENTLSVFLTGRPWGRSGPVPPVRQEPLSPELFADLFADVRREFRVT